MLTVFQNDPNGRQARRAREWFSKNGPPDLQPLPLGYNERERLKHGGADHILAWFARSLDNRDYDVGEHPSFHDYACGVMASEFAPTFIKVDQELKKRFPARELGGLGPGLQWLQPKEHAKVMEGIRRRRALESNYVMSESELRAVEMMVKRVDAIFARYGGSGHGVAR
jgi:hypothetical protein